VAEAVVGALGRCAHIVLVKLLGELTIVISLTLPAARAPAADARVEDHIAGAALVMAEEVLASSKYQHVVGVVYELRAVIVAEVRKKGGQWRGWGVRKKGRKPRGADGKASSPPLSLLAHALKGPHPIVPINHKVVGIQVHAVENAAPLGVIEAVIHAIEGQVWLPIPAVEWPCSAKCGVWVSGAAVQ
jgi:hypothetical protein